MRIKTIIIIVLTILITVVLMQNTGPVTFTILFSDVHVSKLVVLAIIALFAFILGILVGRPRRTKYISNDFPEKNENYENPNTLSDEDREYISGK
jgi:uncharacterized integral membrane protein